jgi:hypothetical protein
MKENNTAPNVSVPCVLCHMGVFSRLFSTSEPDIMTEMIYGVGIAFPLFLIVPIYLNTSSKKAWIEGFPSTRLPGLVTSQRRHERKSESGESPGLSSLARGANTLRCWDSLWPCIVVDILPGGRYPDVSRDQGLPLSCPPSAVGAKKKRTRSPIPASHICSAVI